MDIVDLHFNSELGFGKHKNTAIELLKKTIDILEEFNITYFLISGTLLGYIRHHDFIPWDDDIDLMVDCDILNKLDDIVMKHKDFLNFFMKGNYIIKLCFKNRDKRIKCIWDKFGLNEPREYHWPFVDFFLFKYNNDSEIEFFNRKWDIKYFFPLIKADFNDIKVNIPKDSTHFLEKNYGKDYMSIFKSNIFSHKNEKKIHKTATLKSEDYYNIIEMINKYKTKIGTGVDVKLLQYKDISENPNVNNINLRDIIDSKHFINKKSNNSNAIVINIESHIDRYNSVLKELKKIDFNNFVHLKATYWKNRNILENDLNIILNFLKQFNENIKDQNYKINEFSEINDKNINIQDGPLACYSSHLRAMIYGYLNFKDYTIIIEDDILINDTDSIKEYIEKVPNDWDIICLNSIPKNIKNTSDDKSELYKFTSEFHSTHFYIINNKCFPTIFKNMYPITDQVDVLISNLINTLNIYNITNVVYQKSISTNTQNNLYAIFNSPNYSCLRSTLEVIKELLFYFANIILPNNKRNNVIVSNIMFDIIYLYVINYNEKNIIFNHEYKQMNDVCTYNDNSSQYYELVYNINIFLQCCIKGTDISNISNGVINNIFNTLTRFNLHDTIDIKFSDKMKAYSYGSTAHIYYLENSNVIIKVYNKKLRWITDNHSIPKEIFNKELDILKQQKSIKLLDYDTENMVLKMKYEGESLYDNFILPENWKEQIKNIFNEFNKYNVYYTEFRLQNILVKNNIIKIVDFGLAKNIDNCNNDNNCNVFIELLDLLNNRFKTVTNNETKNLLYTTLMHNIKVHNMKKYSDNVY